jgi:hypothetical protein
MLLLRLSTRAFPFFSTEAGCKNIGARLKGSGMPWTEDGAATAVALHALYVSVSKVWDGFWAQHRRAAARSHSSKRRSSMAARGGRGILRG